jgi:hypothetical protein
MQIADDLYASDEYGVQEIGHSFLRTARYALDTAIDFSPGVSLVKDLISITTGVNPVTGEQLSDLELGITVATLWTPSYISGSSKVFGRIMIAVEKHADEMSAAAKVVGAVKSSDSQLGAGVGRALGEHTGEIVDSAKKIGATTAEDVKSYGHLIGETSKRAPEATNIVDFERLRATLAVEEIQGAKVIGSAMKADVQHRATSFALDAAAKDGRVFALKGGDGVTRNLLQVEGELDDVKGIFEWIVGPEGLTHQRFIKGGQITGLPNQVPR